MTFSYLECNAEIRVIYETISRNIFDLFFQIWWTALSLALGLEVRGDIIKGLPCVKRFNQLFCPSAGNTYPM